MGCAPALMLLYSGGHVHRRMPDFVWCAPKEIISRKGGYPSGAFVWLRQIGLDLGSREEELGLIHCDS